MTRPFAAKSVKSTPQEEAKGGVGYGKLENGEKGSRCYKINNSSQSLIFSLHMLQE